MENTPMAPKPDQPKKKKTWLITIIAVAIIAAAGGFVVYHFLAVRPHGLRAGGFAGAGGDINYDTICQQTQDRQNNRPAGGNPGGNRTADSNRQGNGAPSDSNGGNGNGQEYFTKINEYCADGKIDDQEKADLEANRPTFQRPSTN